MCGLLFGGSFTGAAPVDQGTVQMQSIDLDGVDIQAVGDVAMSASYYGLSGSGTLLLLSNKGGGTSSTYTFRSYPNLNWYDLSAHY